MRLSAGAVLNAIAWLLIAGLIGVATVVANIFGAIGLILLGALTALICARAEMAEEAPTWGTEVFKAQITDRASPEQRAAHLSERQTRVAPLRFYGCCGLTVRAFGVVIFFWQQWRG
jgi:hypothetical protein